MGRYNRPADIRFPQHTVQPGGLLVGPDQISSQTGAATVTRPIGNDKAVAAGERQEGEGNLLSDTAKSVQHDDGWPMALVEEVALAATYLQAIGGVERPAYGAVILRMRYVCHGAARTPIGGVRFGA